MAHNLAPHARKVTVYLVVPGQATKTAVVSPVDAREYVAQGWQYEAPETTTEPSPSLTEQLEALSLKQLKEIAEKAKIPVDGKKADVVAALLPHLAAGTLNLEDVGFRVPVAPSLPMQAAI